jgi:GDPmannose 4,6-dehydratase
MWRMLQRETSWDYIIATGESHSRQDFVAEAFVSLGLDWREHVQSNADLFRPSDLSWSQGCAAKALENLGWQARFNMRDVVSKMIARVQADA